jgi:hypothetical protein
MAVADTKYIIQNQFLNEMWDLLIECRAGQDNDLAGI